jgi:hypothetical protein
MKGQGDGIPKTVFSFSRGAGSECARNPCVEQHVCCSTERKACTGSGVDATLFISEYPDDGRGSKHVLKTLQC